MTVFVDTSALYAALSADDTQHREARSRWTELLLSEEPLITTNYVIVETMALLARRLGMDAVRIFESELLPSLQVVWIDESLHQRAISALLAVGKQDLSLVDCASFEVMRERGVRAALAFDRHFADQGFRCL